MQGPLIEADELAERLRSPGWVAVDCRFDLRDTQAGRAAYARGHIPGARYADLDRDLARAPGPGEGRHPLPDPEDFAARLGAWGIDESTAVVAYDADGGAVAARLWWLLRWLNHERAYVLNGGIQAWQRAGLPLETDEPSWLPVRYPARAPRAEWVVATADVAREQARGALLVDARAAARYRGEQEPIDPVAGHVPGARNWPFGQSLAPDGRFRPAAELAAGLEALVGGRPPSEVIAMCGSGVTACHVLLALSVAGLGDGRLYAGSWSEWIRDPARPVSKGEEP
ncbi:MAG TPA: sulfurtransferase [Gammaproteobacteria bacterium]